MIITMIIILIVISTIAICVCIYIYICIYLFVYEDFVSAPWGAAGSQTPHLGLQTLPPLRLRLSPPTNPTKIIIETNRNQLLLVYIIFVICFRGRDPVIT